MSHVNELLARINESKPLESHGLDIGVNVQNNTVTPVAHLPDMQKSVESLAQETQQAKLDKLLGRIAKLTGHESITRDVKTPKKEIFVGKANPMTADSASETKMMQMSNGEFMPPEPKTFAEASLTDSQVEELALKFLLSKGEGSGREISDQLKLPFVLIEEMLRQMKSDQWLFHKGAAPMNDYVFSLTDKGRERARRHIQHCTYYGAAPVSLFDYIASVRAQSLEEQHPTIDDLKRAFEDIQISDEMLLRLGPAVNSGRGMFLFGPAGNGKTSVAERVTKAFGEYIWIPRALAIDGEIIRLFDPNAHVVAPLQAESGMMEIIKPDRRWIRVRRPTIVVGGELTMENLEVTLNRATNISEAPVQLKSNCGTLVIDDFGRQKMSIDQLLNRWIVPLEKRYDFLNLPSGKKIQVPFDQLVIFSTNLQPRDLVDDAFLRRIPYKIDICDPTEEQFRTLLKTMIQKMGFEYRQGPIDHLIEKHYKATNRPFRNCQPRDLLMQIKNFCMFMNQPAELKNEYFDLAVQNYFSVM